MIETFCGDSCVLKKYSINSSTDTITVNCWEKIVIFTECFNMAGATIISYTAHSMDIYC